jgi:hypothetical protein
MRRVTAILSVAAVVLMAAGLVAQGKPSFAGDWMMVGPDGRGDPRATFTITQSATAMTLEYKGCHQEPPSGKLTYKLDGSASKNMMAGRAGSARISRCRAARDRTTPRSGARTETSTDVIATGAYCSRSASSTAPTRTRFLGATGSLRGFTG